MPDPGSSPRPLAGRWFRVRITPYRTLENLIDGVVITFADITASKLLEADLRTTQAVKAYDFIREQVGRGRQAYIVLPQIDKDAERARLGKEIARLESQIEVARARLGNSSFVDRAPAAVIEETRKRLAADEAKHSDMRSQLGKLG